MRVLFNDFERSIETYVPDSSLRSRIVAAAIARAAVDLANVPSSALESPSNHFNMQELPGIRDVVAQFNESIVFDCKLALEFAHSFWMIRYSAAYPGAKPCYAPSANFFDAVSSVGTYIAADHLTFLNDNSGPILSLACSAMVLIPKLRS